MLGHVCAMAHRITRPPGMSDREYADYAKAMRASHQQQLLQQELDRQEQQMLERALLESRLEAHAPPPPSSAPVHRTACPRPRHEPVEHTRRAPSPRFPLLSGCGAMH